LSIGTRTSIRLNWQRAALGRRFLYTIESLLEAHERAGIDLCVVSNTIHYLRDKTAGESLAFLIVGTTTEPRFQAASRPDR
jgi:hypothetical protein